MFKIIKNVTLGLCFMAIGVIALANQAMASVDLVGVVPDTATPELLAATILAGLAVMWGIRKLVKLINRS